MTGLKNILPIVLMSLTFIIFSTTRSFSENYQCDVNGDNLLGLAEAVNFLRDVSGMLSDGPLAVLECGEPTFEITGSGVLSTEAKRYILCRMNQIRSQTALGIIEDDGTSNYYPIAANMQRMQWDEDLATVANDHAAQCIYEHNPDRNTEYAVLTGIVNPAVGENIAASGISWTIGSTEAVDAIKTAFAGWNGESTLWHYDTINDDSWVAGIGHFTQNIWANTTRVGCGQAWCPDGWPDGGYNMIFTVCNYYTAGNYWNNYPYQSGDEVCSADLHPGDRCENGLVSPEDYITGLVYECDVNGDGLLGLEEVINVLRVLSGASAQ